MGYVKKLLSDIKDSPRGWAIVACIFIATVFRFGVIYGIGPIYVALEQEFHTSHELRSWIIYAGNSFTMLLAPFIVWIIQQLGHHKYRLGVAFGATLAAVGCISSSFVPSQSWLFLTFSPMYGTGGCFMYMANSLILADYFNTTHPWHVLVTSTLMIGYPAASMIFNPVNAYLVKYTGWRGTFRIHGSFCFVVGIISALVFVPKQHQDEERIPIMETNTPSSKTKLLQNEQTNPEDCSKKSIGFGDFFQELQRRPEFITWILANVLQYTGIIVPFVAMDFYLAMKGIPPTQGAWTLVALSMSELLVYIACSLCGDYFKNKLICANIIGSACMGLLYGVWQFLDINYGMVVVLSAVTGVLTALNIAYSYPACSEVTDLPLGLAWSITNLASGVGTLLAAITSGKVFDIRDSYYDVLHCTGGLYGIAAVLFIVTYIMASRRTKQRATSL